MSSSLLGRLARAWEGASDPDADGPPVRYNLISPDWMDHGLVFPEDVLELAFADARGALRHYRPDPRGQLPAREAVAAYHGQGVAPEQVVLTPGTSFGYFAAFSLLGNPGDEILVPWPTYPLFDDLVRLAGRRVRRYHLRGAPGGEWSLDPQELAFQITPRTRAVCLVSPHNPTGHPIGPVEMEAIAGLARRHGLALIFDEVFREFRHTAAVVARPSEWDVPLCLTLNGMSKMAALPGLKAAWVVAEGREAPEFLRALEYLADTFLPVNETVQAMLPRLLAETPRIALQFGQTFQHRTRDILAQFERVQWTVPCPQAGLYLILPLPPGADGRSVARALRSEGILVHEGDAYGLPPESLVVTAVHSGRWPVETLRCIAWKQTGTSFLR